MARRISPKQVNILAQAAKNHPRALDFVGTAEVKMFNTMAENGLLFCKDCRDNEVAAKGDQSIEANLTPYGAQLAIDKGAFKGTDAAKAKFLDKVGTYWLNEGRNRYRRWAASREKVRPLENLTKTQARVLKQAQEVFPAPLLFKTGAEMRVFNSLERRAMLYCEVGKSLGCEQYPLDGGHSGVEAHITPYGAQVADVLLRKDKKIPEGKMGRIRAKFQSITGRTQRTGDQPAALKKAVAKRKAAKRKAAAPKRKATTKASSSIYQSNPGRHNARKGLKVSIPTAVKGSTKRIKGTVEAVNKDTLRVKTSGSTRTVPKSDVVIYKDQPKIATSPRKAKTVAVKAKRKPAKKSTAKAKRSTASRPGRYPAGSQTQDWLEKHHNYSGRGAAATFSGKPKYKVGDKVSVSGGQFVMKCGKGLKGLCTSYLYEFKPARAGTIIGFSVMPGSMYDSSTDMAMYVIRFDNPAKTEQGGVKTTVYEVEAYEGFVKRRRKAAKAAPKKSTAKKSTAKKSTAKKAAPKRKRAPQSAEVKGNKRVKKGDRVSYQSARRRTRSKGIITSIKRDEEIFLNVKLDSGKLDEMVPAKSVSKVKPQTAAQKRATKANTAAMRAGQARKIRTTRIGRLGRKKGARSPARSKVTRNKRYTKSSREYDYPGATRPATRGHLAASTVTGLTGAQAALLRFLHQEGPAELDRFKSKDHRTIKAAANKDLLFYDNRGTSRNPETWLTLTPSGRFLVRDALL